MNFDIINSAFFLESETSWISIHVMSQLSKDLSSISQTQSLKCFAVAVFLGLVFRDLVCVEEILLSTPQAIFLNQTRRGDEDGKPIGQREKKEFEEALIIGKWAQFVGKSIGIDGSFVQLVENDLIEEMGNMNEICSFQKCRPPIGLSDDLAQGPFELISWIEKWNPFDSSLRDWFLFLQKAIELNKP